MNFPNERPRFLRPGTWKTLILRSLKTFFNLQLCSQQRMNFYILQPKRKTNQSCLWLRKKSTPTKICTRISFTTATIIYRSTTNVKNFRYFNTETTYCIYWKSFKHSYSSAKLGLESLRKFLRYVSLFNHFAA